MKIFEHTYNRKNKEGDAKMPIFGRTEQEPEEQVQLKEEQPQEPKKEVPPVVKIKPELPDVNHINDLIAKDTQQVYNDMIEAITRAYEEQKSIAKSKIDAIFDRAKEKVVLK